MATNVQLTLFAFGVSRENGRDRDEDDTEKKAKRQKQKANYEATRERAFKVKWTEEFPWLTMRISTYVFKLWQLSMILYE